MTLALALLARDGIVVAADGRAYTSDQTGLAATQEAVQKIIELEPGKVMLVAGLAELVLGALPATTVELDEVGMETARKVAAPQPPLISPREATTVVRPPQAGTIAAHTTAAEVEAAEIHGWAAYLSKSAATHYRQLFLKATQTAQPQTLRANLSVVVAGYTGKETPPPRYRCVHPTPHCPSRSNDDGWSSDRGKANGSDSGGGKGNLKSAPRPVLLNFSSATNFAVSPVQEPFVAIGAMGLAHYLLRRLYSPALSLEKAAGLAYYCLKEACFQYPLLGGQLSIGLVRPYQPLDLLDEAALLELEQASARFTRWQRESVQKGLSQTPLEFSSEISNRDYNSGPLAETTLTPSHRS